MNYKEILERFHSLDCFRILDAGCGTGKFVDMNENIFGIDIHSPEHPRIRHGNVCYMPYANNEFDGVLSYQVLEHLSVEQAYDMICEVHRVLLPNGIFIINTPYPFSQFWDTFSHVKPYTPKSIKNLLADNYNENPKKIKFDVLDIIYDTEGVPMATILKLTPLLRFLSKHFNFRRCDWTMVLRKAQ